MITRSGLFVEKGERATTMRNYCRETVLVTCLVITSLLILWWLFVLVARP